MNLTQGGTTGRPMPIEEDYRAEVWKIFDHIDKVQADITEAPLTRTAWQPAPYRQRRTAPLHLAIHSRPSARPQDGDAGSSAA